MSVLRSDQLSTRLLSVLARTAVLAVAVVFLAACSTRQASAPRPHLDYVAAKPRDFVPIPAKLEFEDDGIEVQRPPVHQARRRPDDPTQPYSPNYGAIDAGVAAMANDAEPWIVPETADSEFHNSDGQNSEVIDGDID